MVVGSFADVLQPKQTGLSLTRQEFQVNISLECTERPYGISAERGLYLLGEISKTFALRTVGSEFIANSCRNGVRVGDTNLIIPQITVGLVHMGSYSDGPIINNIHFRSQSSRPERGLWGVYMDQPGSRGIDTHTIGLRLKIRGRLNK